MRTILFTLVIAGLNLWFSAAAQPYQPVFSTENIRWNVLEAACDAFSTDSIVPRGDTIIDNQHYRVLLQQGPWIEPTYHFVREDTIAGRMWVYKENFQREFLLMDLGLAVGDTFYIHRSYQAALLDSTAFRVDSVFFLNGIKHVRIEAYIAHCYYIDTIAFIEGVGPNTGPDMHFRLNQVYVKSYVLCMFKEGERVYMGPMYSDFPDPCWVFGTDVETNALPDLSLKVYPNPSSDLVTIEVPYENIPSIQVQILSIAGITVESHAVRTYPFTLSVAHLPRGVYIVRVSLNGATLISQFIKL